MFIVDCKNWYTDCTIELQDLEMAEESHMNATGTIEVVKMSLTAKNKTNFVPKARDARQRLKPPALTPVQGKQTRRCRKVTVQKGHCEPPDGPRPALQWSSVAFG